MMKYTLIIILLFSAPALFAQELHVGPKLDITIPQVSGKGISSGTTGFTGGYIFSMGAEPTLERAA